MHACLPASKKFQISARGIFIPWHPAGIVCVVDCMLNCCEVDIYTVVLSQPERAYKLLSVPVVFAFAALSELLEACASARLP